MNQRVDVGGVLSRVFGIYGSQAGTLLPLALLLYLPGSILSAVGGVVALLGVIVSLVAAAVFTGMVVRLVEDVQDGSRDWSMGQLFQSVTPFIGTLVVAGIVFSIPVGIGFVFIIVPGLLLWTIWSVFAPAIVIERAGVFDSLGRSRALVRGNFGAVFGVITVVFLITRFVPGIINFAIVASAGVGAAAIVGLVLSTLLGPIAALASGVLYFELRGAGGPQDAFAGGGPEAAGTNAPPPPPPPPGGAAV